MRHRRQAEIDERERRRRVELAQERDGARARLAGMHFEIVAEREGERVGDERIVVDDEERRPRFRRVAFRHVRAGRHGCIS